MNVFARNILLVDDHALLQHALRSMLEPLLAGGEIVCAASAQEAVSALRAGRNFHLVLLDLKLPDSDGLRLMSLLRREIPGVPVAIFSGQDAPIYRQLAREAEADGFLSKSMDPVALVDGVRALLAGRRFYDDQFDRNRATNGNGGQSESRARPKLSPKQERVLCCLMEGLSNKEIALRLDLSERTVKMHLTSVYHVLGVNTRSQAILVGQTLHLSMPAEDA
ncbi:MAG: response regulator transcription factor [Candidatus Dactylopiibacterium sp.]|nr:response regulator transcription factor [Candidatus Dactylopiibacterium sp.]